VRRLPNRRRKPRASPDRSRRRINGVEKCPNRNNTPQGRDQNESLTTVRSRTGENRPRKRPRCRTLTLDVYCKDGGRAWTECRENSDGASVATSENGGKNRLRRSVPHAALHKKQEAATLRDSLLVLFTSARRDRGKRPRTRTAAIGGFVADPLAHWWVASGPLRSFNDEIARVLGSSSYS
jgi:hypothetical protein